MTGRLLRGMVVFSLMVTMWQGPAFAQETGEPSTSAPQKMAEKKVDLLLSGHLIGFFSQNEDLFIGGNRSHCVSELSSWSVPVF